VIRFKADLHIHTCLSPCGDPKMSPGKIIEKSCKKGLDIIGVCDHNSMENAGSVMWAGKKMGISVLPGMEICSKEEVHILGLFENLEQALSMQEYVYANLPGENQPEMFGEQIIVDKNDEVMGKNSKLLIGATSLGLLEIIEKIHILGGISIAAHVNRPAFGIIRQLGFIPNNLGIDGVEVSRHISIIEARKKISEIKGLPCVTFSDAHFPDDIGIVWTVFKMAAPSFKEISLALKGKRGRMIEV